MKEFVMIYRGESLGEIKLNPDGTLAISKEWENWMGGIAAQNKLVSGGMRLGNEGRTIKPGNVITDGPYAEIKEIIGGLSIFRGESIEEVTEMAKSCPVLKFGGNVEVRDVMQLNN
ncbi:MAG TPA: YciI family protein [Mucilaginibacter sp.]|nr:YciI family protein [Mucilaginibacter sp.]